MISERMGRILKTAAGLPALGGNPMANPADSRHMAIMRQQAAGGAEPDPKAEIDGIKAQGEQGRVGEEKRVAMLGEQAKDIKMQARRMKAERDVAQARQALNDAQTAASAPTPAPRMAPPAAGAMKLASGPMVRIGDELDEGLRALEDMLRVRA